MSWEDIERLQQKLARDPDSKLFVPLAEEYKKAGMVEEAIRVLIEGLERQPHYLSARVSLGKIYMEKGLLPEAREEFQKVIGSIPDNLYAHKKLAEIYRELGEQDQTIDELKIVLNLNPTDEWGISTLATIEKERESGQMPEEAPADVVSALPQALPEESTEVLEEPEIIAVPPPEEEAVEKIPEDDQQPYEAEASEPRPAQDAILEAENCIKQNRFSEAMDIYKGILSGDPENAQVLQRVAELKALFRVLGKDQDARILHLERFLGGIKKRRDEFFETLKGEGGNSG